MEQRKDRVNNGKETVFDKDQWWGDFIEIVPYMEFSFFRGRVFSGDWNELNIEKVSEKLIEEYKEFVPKEYWAQVEIIIRAPVNDGDPLHRTGTISWKYVRK